MSPELETWFKSKFAEIAEIAFHSAYMYATLKERGHAPESVAANEDIEKYISELESLALAQPLDEFTKLRIEEAETPIKGYHKQLKAYYDQKMS
jgi:hypothetical protein